MGSMFSVEYLTARRRGRLEFHVAGEADIVAFFGLFGTVEGRRIKTAGIQRATPELKSRVAAFCAARRRQAPQLGAFAKLIADLAQDEAFLILPTGDRTSREVAHLEMLVGWANGEVSVSEIEEFDRSFGRVLEEYDVINPGTDRHVQIGNAPISRRRCRFCHRTKAQGAIFAGRAHAISRGLGNMHLKLADECNSYFGAELEPHLLAFLDIQRVFLGIEGRSGSPRVAVRGGEMLHNGAGIVVAVQADQVGDVEDGFAIEVMSEVAIVPERCYRSLAKFALSVIPEPELLHLKATAEWVRHGVRPKGRILPIVYGAVVPLPPNPSAQLALYVRRSAAARLPHVVGEFRLGCFVYVFVLPFSDRDVDGPAFIGHQDFLDVFPHYAKVPHWRPYDLGGTTPLAEPATMRIVPRVAPAPAVQEAAGETLSQPHANDSCGSMDPDGL